MSGLDKYLMGERLAKKGWIENDEGRWMPPQRIVDYLVEGYFTLDEAEEVESLISGEPLDNG